METRSIINKNNIKKIEIEKSKNGLRIEICNIIEDERTLCCTTLTKSEVMLFISQLSELLYKKKVLDGR